MMNSLQTNSSKIGELITANRKKRKNGIFKEISSTLFWLVVRKEKNKDTIIPNDMFIKKPLTMYFNKFFHLIEKKLMCTFVIFVTNFITVSRFTIMMITVTVVRNKFILN